MDRPPDATMFVCACANMPYAITANRHRTLSKLFFPPTALVLEKRNVGQQAASNGTAQVDSHAYKPRTGSAAITDMSARACDGDKTGSRYVTKGLKVEGPTQVQP